MHGYPLMGFGQVSKTSVQKLGIFNEWYFFGVYLVLGLDF